MEPKRHSFRFQAAEPPSSDSPRRRRRPRSTACPPANNGFTKSSSTATAFRATSPMPRRRCSRGAEGLDGPEDRQQPSRPCAAPIRRLSMQPHQKRSAQDDWRDAEGHYTPKQSIPQNKASLKTSRLRCMAVPFHPRCVCLVKD